MGDLIFTHRHIVALIDHDIRRLQHRITQKTVGAQVLIFNIVALFLVGGHSFQPAQRGNHGE